MNPETDIGPEPNSIALLPLYWAARADWHEEHGNGYRAKLARNRAGEEERYYLSNLRSRFQFFLREAGGIVGERAVTALSLAKAEIWAEGEGVDVTWVDDPEGYHPGDWPESDVPEVVLTCTAVLRAEYDRPERYASLGGIGNPTPEYRRMTAAELCCEIMQAGR